MPHPTKHQASITGDASVTMEQVMEHHAVAQKMPTWKEAKEAFGEQAVASRTVNLDINTREGRENRRKLADAWQPWLNAEENRGAKAQAGIERSTLRDRDGRRYEVPSAREEQLARAKGLVPVQSYKGNVCTGPDGLLYRRVGSRWESTGRKCLTTPLFEGEERRAPAGFVH